MLDFYAKTNVFTIYNILDKLSINILYYLIDNINKGTEQGYRTLF